jgi:hypothetical protein
MPMGEDYHLSNSCGKTTLARLLAKCSDAAFKELSATDSGVGQLREAFEEAKNLRKLTRRSVHPLRTSPQSYPRAHRKTIIFFDEIHRFNKAQQVSEPTYPAFFPDNLIGITGRIPPIRRTRARSGLFPSGHIPVSHLTGAFTADWCYHGKSFVQTQRRSSEPMPVSTACY